jgi:hydrogenase nickel incorporation protein HypA/HybF
MTRCWPGNPQAVTTMHELAVCQALMEQVENIAIAERADHVASIRLGIGPLSGVEPCLLEQAFFIASAGSIAADAQLVIESLPVRVSCEQCGESTDALPARLICGNCGNWRTKLVSGDELLLTHVELVRQSPAEPEAVPQTGRQQVN